MGKHPIYSLKGWTILFFIFFGGGAGELGNFFNMNFFPSCGCALIFFRDCSKFFFLLVRCASELSFTTFAVHVGILFRKLPPPPPRPKKYHNKMVHP